MFQLVLINRNGGFELLLEKIVLIEFLSVL